MPKKDDVEFPIPYNLRVNAKFVEAVKRLRHLDADVPSGAEVIRQAVKEKLERTEAEHAKKTRRS